MADESLYPGALDTIAADKGNHTDNPSDHPNHHNHLAKAIKAVQATLGTDPQGEFDDVAAWLAELEARPVSGKELVITELVSTSNLVTGTTPTDVTGMQIDVPASAEPIEIEVYCPELGGDTNANNALLSIYGVTEAAIVAQSVASYVATGIVTLLCKARVDPSASIRTYKVQLCKGGAAAGNVYIVGTSTRRAWIRAITR